MNDSALLRPVDINNILVRMFREDFPDSIFELMVDTDFCENYWLITKPYLKAQSKENPVFGVFNIFFWHLSHYINYKKL